jgi:hypothetical protein
VLAALLMESIKLSVKAEILHQDRAGFTIIVDIKIEGR